MAATPGHVVRLVGWKAPHQEVPQNLTRSPSPDFEKTHGLDVDFFFASLAALVGLSQAVRAISVPSPHAPHLGHH
jgi:hypothetical protein